MTPYERLLLEAIPTGNFGGERPPTDPTTRQWTAQEQLDHRRALDDALDGWEYAEHTRPATTTRHLTPVPTQDTEPTTDAA